MGKIEELYKKIPTEYIILIAVVFIIVWMAIAFRIFYFGCFNPIVTMNTSAIDDLDCGTIEKLIISDGIIPSNRTMYCERYNRTITKTDYYGQEYLRKVYDSKCLK